MAADIASDRTPLIIEPNTVRQRSGKNKGGNKEDARRGSDWDPNLPYGGKVYLARRKKPDPWWITALEVRKFNSGVTTLSFYDIYLKHEWGICNSQHSYSDSLHVSSSVGDRRYGTHPA